MTLRSWQVGGAVVMGFGALLGCSDDGPSGDARETGGGGSQTMAGGGGGTGGSVGSAVGGATSSAGGQVSSGGASSPSTLDPAATAGCPTLSVGRLAPAVGVFLSPSTPGPCTQVDTIGETVTIWTLAYDANGRVTSNTSDTGIVETYQYEGDRIVTINRNGALHASYTYADSVVTMTMGKVVGTWSLDSLGYPRELTVVNANYSPPTTSGYRYDYENCRIARRALLTGASDDAMADWTYTYDAQGNLQTLTSPNAFSNVFDYSCWQ